MSRRLACRFARQLPALCGPALLAATVWTASARAQSFDPSIWVTDGYVQATAQAENTLYIGGSFALVSLYTGGGIAVSLATGSPAGQFPRVTGDVGAVVPDGGGGWFIGGNFTAVGGLPRSHLAHVLADGTVSSWNPNANTGVSAMAIRGSKVYVGGNFTSVGGATRNCIAALDASTGLATAWDPNASGGSFPAIYALAVTSSTVYVGGTFATIGGQPRTNIAALDPNVNTNNATAWDPNANGGLSPLVSALAVSGTTVYVGGRFTNIGGQPRNNIAALDATVATNNATAWDPNSSGLVSALAVSGTTIYVGGQFATIGGQTRTNVAALDATIDTNNATAWNPVASDRVSALAVNGTSVYAGGPFTTIGGQARNRLAALDATTGAATAWNPNMNCFTCGQASVSALAVSGTAIYAGGPFASVNGVTRHNIAAIDLTTGAATAWDPNAGGFVDALAVSGTRVYAGGAFTTIGGRTRNRIAALDASVNTNNALPWNPNAGNVVTALAVSGTTVYAAGAFTSIGGQPRQDIAALDATLDTLNATAWNPGPTGGGVSALAVNGTTVYAGGTFSAIGGQPRNRIAALDATVNTSNATAWDPNANGTVSALAVSGTVVYAGGQFTGIGGQTRNRLAALAAAVNTGNATAWDPNANAGVTTLAVDGGTVYAGGQFTAIGSSARTYLAAIDAATGSATAWSPNPSTVVYAVRISAPRIVVGGAFASIAGQAEPSLAVFAQPGAAGVPVSSRNSELLLTSSPNPARTRVALRFALPAAGPVSLALFDVAGRRVATLAEREPMAAGPHELALSTGALRAGLYFARLECGPLVASRRVMVIR